MSEYIAVEKGKLISSSSNNRKKKKKKHREIGAGCGGVFFQIFHGKRLFSWKSLPEARPPDHADDKLPVAKLLLDTDESIGRLQQSGSSPDDFPKTQPKQESPVIEHEPDGLHGKKVPNLVARLMGLETLPPSPEAVIANLKEIHADTNGIDYKPPCKNVELIKNSNVNTYHAQPTKTNPRQSVKEDRREKKILSTRNNSLSRVNKEKDKEELYKSKGTSNRPPHELDSSFPFASPPPKKDPTFHKKTFPRATKINEAKMCQLAPKSNRTENVVCLGRNVLPRHQNGVVSNSEKNRSAIPGVLNHNEQESKIRIRSRNASIELANKSDRNKSLLHELQRRYKYQQELTKQINSELEKVRAKRDAHGEVQSRRSKQEETSRRLSQLSSRSSNSNRVRHSSSLKPQLGSKNTAGFSIARRSLPSSKTGEVSRIVSSRVGSNVVPTVALSISSVNGCLEQSEEGSNSIEQKRPSNKVLDERPTAFDTASIDEVSNSESVEYLQSSSTPMNNASEFLRNPEALSCSDYEKVQSRWENDDNGNEKVFGAKRVLDFLKVEPSSCDSLFEDSGDTGCSSRGESDVSSRTCDSAPQSDKNNVSAILHELLAALSSSKSGLESKKEPRGDESKIMCLGEMSPEFVVQEKSLGHNQYSLRNDVRDRELESMFEVSDCSNMSEFLESKEVQNTRFKPTHSESMDCSISSMDITQGEDSDACDEVTARMTKMPEQTCHDYLSDTTVDCNALLNTISRLHSIDPEAIGLTLKKPMYMNDTLIGCRDETTISCAPSLDDKMQSSEQLFSLSSSSASANGEGEINSNSCTVRQGMRRYEDPVVQNKKLLLDCLNEAFRRMGKQMYGISSIINPSSASLVLSKVYKQIDDWKGMSIGMNLDDMVEKEMNASIGRWQSRHDLSDEAEERAEAIESTIFDRLVEEFVLELM